MSSTDLSSETSPGSRARAADVVLAHFIVADDVERSRRFYTEVLGGSVVFSGEVTYVARAARKSRAGLCTRDLDLGL